MIRIAISVFLWLVSSAAFSLGWEYKVDNGTATGTKSSALAQANAICAAEYPNALSVRLSAATDVIGAINSQIQASVWENGSMIISDGSFICFHGSMTFGRLIPLRSRYICANDSEVLAPSACPTCNQGAVSGWAKQTTIASFTSFGAIVASPIGSNLQCTNSCTVALYAEPGTGFAQCAAYVNPTLGQPVVGHAVFSYCEGQLTGERCNETNAQTLENVPEIPTGWEEYEGTTDPPTGGTPGQYDLEIRNAVQSTATSAATSATSLSTIASNQVTAEGNAQARHTDLLGRLDAMVTSLMSIDGKTPQSGTGGTGIGDGTGQITGGDSITNGDLVAEQPAGGLKLPGEGNIGFQRLLSGEGIGTRPAGTCPTWRFQIEYFGADVTMDAHCTLWAEAAPTLEVMMIALWTLAGLRVVLSA